jgi:E2F/DP family winged-helix DNA-binding domain
LGVERRRIYDVVNILESIQLVSKEKKNTYKWMGTQKMDEVFGKLQAQAILEHPDDANAFLGLSDDVVTAAESRGSSKTTRSHVNKSLAKLSQEFLQVYLVGFKTLSLPEASDKIQGATSIEELISIGGGPDLRYNADGSPNHEDEKKRKAAAARGLKTKIRRLYDIANVFMSVGLLQKIETTATGATRRPNFSWNYKLSAQEIRALHLETEKNSNAVPAGTSKVDVTCSEMNNIPNASFHSNIDQPCAPQEKDFNEEIRSSELDVSNLPVLSEEEKKELDAPFLADSTSAESESEINM